MQNDIKINNIEDLSILINKVREAQEVFSNYNQKQVDKIFFEVAVAASKNRIPLAKMAVSETGMGIVEDKVIKNLYSSEYIYNYYRDTKTCGIIEQDEHNGIKKIASPIGLIAGIIPTTNPTSTAIFKVLLALKTRNGIIISPHPKAKACTTETVRILLEAAINAGAPKDIIGVIDSPSLEMTNFLMKSADLILATGGPGMVKSAYSSGKPAIGVGAGNVPAIIDTSADVKVAVNSIIHSKTFDNGMICASEQSVIVLKNVYENVKQEFTLRGCHILSPEEIEKVRKTMIIDGSLNSKIVGQTAFDIAKMSGINVAPETKILIGEVQSIEHSEEFTYEKLSPVLAMYRAEDFDDALNKAEKLIELGGLGHTSAIYVDEFHEKSKIDKLSKRIKTGRILVNMPASHGAIGDIYNFKMPPSLTIGCGSWGGNSTSENISVKHLINIKTVVERRENMLWFKTPDKIYIKKGCLSFALKEIKTELKKKRVFIVTDSFLFKNGHTKCITDVLNELNIEHSIFFDVEPDPTLSCARKGAEAIKNFEPDCIIAIGGGSAMDAAKIMWLLYEYPNASFENMSMRFMDIRKRVYEFPKLGEKAYFVAIPTTAGTGSEVTPFAVITEDETKIKYPVTDYQLLPNMAIIDANLMMEAPKGLTASSGIDALTHALESYVSLMATDYTDSLAIKAMEIIFEYLPRAYKNGSSDSEAREKMADAATIAGMAFANAFLGVCHSMAHKLGAMFHIPHGIANALLINRVIRFNAADTPVKMGTFSQYKYPKASEKYQRISTHFGFNEKSDKIESLILAIENLKKEIDIKPSIKDYGISEEDFLEKLDILSEQAFDDQCTGTNPRYPLIREIKQMYLNSFYGK